MASMTKVTLAKSIRLPGDRLRRVGEVVEVSDEVHQRFAPLGVFVVDEPAPEPEPAPGPTGMKRPAKTAPLDTWRAYAREQDIDPKGLTKAEIIAATT